MNSINLTVLDDRNDETSVWSADNGPTDSGFIFYCLVVPFICLFGAITNILNAIIFSRPRMTASAYVYLAGISIFDFISCVLLGLSGLARSAFFKNFYWQVFDTMVCLPVGGITGGASSIIAVAVAMDRLIYIKSFLPKGSPRFCRRKHARHIIFAALTVSLVLNTPYFFIYEIVDNKVCTTQFFETTIYMIHNWIKFILLGLLPAIFLLIANGIMISVIRKWSKCCHLLKNSGCRERRRICDQTHLTITLIAVVFLFLIGEIPSHFASRKSAIAMLYSGDMTQTDSPSLENFRIIATILNAMHISLNIVIYATLNPPYMIELFDFLKIIFIKWHFRYFKSTEKVKEKLEDAKNAVKCLIHNHNERHLNEIPKDAVCTCHRPIDPEKLAIERQVSQNDSSSDCNYKCKECPTDQCVCEDIIEYSRELKQPMGDVISIKIQNNETLNDNKLKIFNENKEPITLMINESKSIKEKILSDLNNSEINGYNGGKRRNTDTVSTIFSSTNGTDNEFENATKFEKKPKWSLGRLIGFTTCECKLKVPYAKVNISITKSWDDLAQCTTGEIDRSSMNFLITRARHNSMPFILNTQLPKCPGNKCQSSNIASLICN